MAKAIGGLFGQGPLGPLYEHLSVVGEALDALERLLGLLIEDDHEAVVAAAEAVDQAEQRADTIKTAIRARLAGGVFAATQRAEVIGLLGAQDDVADHCQRLAWLAALRQTPCPKSLASRLRKFGDAVLAMGRELIEAVRQFNAGKTDGGGFHDGLGRAIGRQDACQELLQKYLLMLFKREKKLDPTSVMFLMRFGEQLGKVARKVANAAEIYERAKLLSG